MFFLLYQISNKVIAAKFYTFHNRSPVLACAILEEDYDGISKMFQVNPIWIWVRKFLKEVHLLPLLFLWAVHKINFWDMFTDIVNLGLSMDE